MKTFDSGLRRGSGFTILELALTLSIIAVISVGVLVPLVAQVTQRKISDTERILEQAKETLMGFAAANGRLPCPATANTDGFEKFSAVAVGSIPAGNVANGNCATFNGFLPAATLGFTPVDEQGYAIDGWRTRFNRIRYAVSNATTTVPNTTTALFTFTGANGMRYASASTIASSALLYVCASGASSTDPNVHCGPGAAGTGGSTTLTANAPAVIWSLGANAATGGTGTDEAQNLNSTRVFVSRNMFSTATAEFDDIVTWLSVGNLVSRMVLAGQLP